MKMRLYLFSLLMASATGLTAQDHTANLGDAAARIIQERRSGENQELGLHTDKAHYRLGTPIWFRVYLLNALTRLPARSARIHVDLYDREDSLVSTLLLNSAGNEMDGSIRTSAAWAPGPYLLKVYTEEMAAGPAPGRPLEQPVFLFGSDASLPVTTLAERQVRGMGFYPEGGSLINGLSNTVAFRCVSEAGVPLDVQGYLRDDQGRTVETFRTSVPGYGTFRFTPSRNRSYRAFLILPDKTEKSFPLTASSPSSWQICLTRDLPEAFVFRVAQGDSLYPLKPVSYVCAIAGGSLVFAGIGNGVYEIRIPRSVLPQGPVDVYLFNEKKEVVSRRQVFVSAPSALLSIQPDKPGLSSRAFVNLDLDLKDNKGQPLAGILSISVTDDRYVALPPSRPRNTIMDITDPLDAAPRMYPPLRDSAMTVSGILTDDAGRPAAGYVANLVSTADNILLSDTTDETGAFRYRVPEFYDGKPYALHVTDLKGKISALRVSTLPQYHAWPREDRTWVPDTLNRVRACLTAQADSFLTGSSMMAIQQALAPAKAKKKPEADVRNRNSRMITGEQLDKLGLGTTSQAVMMLPGIVMVNGKITITGGTAAFTGGDNLEPLVITDGVPATNSGVAQYLNSIPPQNIESIEVMTGPEAAQYGTRGINGVIIVKTAKSIREIPMESGSGPGIIRPQGYHEAKPFYIPPYQEPAVRALGFTDNRSTIFWKGEVVVDRNGKARLGFYAADQPSGYTVQVKGITARGELIDKTIHLGMK
jgi:TonB-dependent SusC/RagA subfamily outer membrane receptor